MFDTAETSRRESSPEIPTTLDGIRAPVSEELDRFQEVFRDTMRSENSRLLNHISRYVHKQKGKQIRPLLVLLSAKLCGSVTPATYHGASLVELLHTATLVHDDVVDRAERRRGVFSINALWKNKVSVLFGDFLLSRGLLLALDEEQYELLQVVSDAVRRMSEGELLQIEKSRKLNIDEETYFRIISDKTASLFSACMQCGAVSATDDPEAQDRLREIGETLGLAFQIRDDLFDYGLDDVGKPLGIDIQDKKMTLPLIAALREAPTGRRRKVIRIVKKDEKDADDIETVNAFVREFDGIGYARSEMNELAEEAWAMLEEFAPSPAKNALLGLVEFTVTRSR